MPIEHTVFATALASPWCSIHFYGMWCIQNGLLAKVLWTFYSFLVNFMLGCKKTLWVSLTACKHVCVLGRMELRNVNILGHCPSWVRFITSVISFGTAIADTQYVSACIHICFLSVSFCMCKIANLHIFKKTYSAIYTCKSTHKYIYILTTTML